MKFVANDWNVEIIFEITKEKKVKVLNIIHKTKHDTSKQILNIINSMINDLLLPKKYLFRTYWYNIFGDPIPIQIIKEDN